MKNELSLSRADGGMIQDAWHYAKYITNRSESTFDGSRKFPAGLIGQVRAYERLLDLVDKATANNETFQIIPFQHPRTIFSMKQKTHTILASVENAATRLGIEARLGRTAN